MRKKLTNFIYTTHRLLGTLLSALFLVWFLSAFVMMYHSFPKLTTEKKIQKFETLMADSLSPIDSILRRVPAGEQITQITLSCPLEKAIFCIETTNNQYTIPAINGDSLPMIDANAVLAMAKRWCASPIKRMDTLYKLDQWIPFGALKKEFPIYKFHFNDPEQHQLYIGSQSGEPLQFTTKEARTWAWLGAIPHWVYFTWLRQDATLWSQVVIGLSALGCFMLLAGLWMGFEVWRNTRKRPGSFSPYKKKWHHWHYVTGIIFGVTVLTFCFSGMMSLAEVPQWISRTELKKSPINYLNEQPLNPEKMGDYRVLVKQIKGIKELKWKRLGTVDFYEISMHKGRQQFRWSGGEFQPLELTRDEVLRAIQPIHSPQAKFTVTQLHQFETYYRDMSRMYKNKALLPVWKIEVDDHDQSCYYIHPKTGEVKYINQNSRIKYWTYTALHRLRIQGLNSSPQLRKGILWVLLIGGTMVSLSGVVLGIRYLRRKTKKYNRRQKRRGLSSDSLN